jgi:hypothetical protein
VKEGREGKGRGEKIREEKRSDGREGRGGRESKW